MKEVVADHWSGVLFMKWGTSHVGNLETQLHFTRYNDVKEVQYLPKKFDPVSDKTMRSSRV